MSASERSSIQSPDAALKRLKAQRRRRRTGGPWFFVSVLLHAVGIAALIYLTPIREIVKEVVLHQKPEQTMSGRQLASLAEAIEMRTGDQIAANAHELERVYDEIADIQDRMAEEFTNFEAGQHANAPADAIEAMETAIVEMGKALGAIEEGAPAEQVDRAQALAEQAQERIGKKLALLPPEVSPVLAHQQAADGSHQTAKNAYYQHTEKVGQVDYRQRTYDQEHQRAETQRARVEQLKQEGRTEEQLKGDLDQLAQQEAREKDAAEQLATQKAENEQFVATALESERAAVEAQTEALERLKEWIAQQPAALTPGNRAVTDHMSKPRQGPSVRDLGSDVPLLYDESRSLEDAVAGSFKEIRAMDLAMVRDMTLEEARGDIDLVRPVRPDLNEQLLREAARTDNLFEAHKEELREALRETSSMVDLAHRMLEMSTQSVDRLRFGTDAGDMMVEEAEAPEFELIIRELAMEEVSGRYSDMAGMMEMLEEGADGARRRRPRGARPDGEGLEMPPPPPPALEGAAGEDFGPLPELKADIPAVGTRKMVATGGEPGEWMYIDSWWTLGPFPNPNRINIDREFPPDSLVDLDATYVGKDGQTIAWKFVQSESPQIIPYGAEPYGIWYAYTEFYCDRPRDVLITMGTDDRGDLKINGVSVWLSSKRLKGWRIDEGWRRVHFSQGVNRILYRVENGWMHVGFSLVMQLLD